MTYDNRGRGSIWKNERKESDTHPDFTGSYTDENGREFWVSAWKRKEGAAEKAPALTFSLKPKEAKRSMPTARTDGRTVTARRSSADIGRDELDTDSIPF